MGLHYLNDAIVIMERGNDTALETGTARLSVNLSGYVRMRNVNIAKNVWILIDEKVWH